jgi:hypothetical protein
VVIRVLFNTAQINPSYPPYPFPKEDGSFELMPPFFPPVEYNPWVLLEKTPRERKRKEARGKREGVERERSKLKPPQPERERKRERTYNI